MKKRIVHCLGQLNTGGAETLVMNILRNIDRNQYQFDFLLFKDQPGFYDEEVEQLNCQLFYTPSMGTAGIKKYIDNLVVFFKNEDIDVVHSHMDWQGGFIAYAAHKAGIKKIIVHSHAMQEMFADDIAHKLLIKISQYLISKYATHCLACSKEAGLSLFNKDFTVLPNGIDMNKYLYPNQDIMNLLRNEFMISDKDIILGHVGSFSENKNQSFLIDVLCELVQTNINYKLILVGGGSYREKIEDKVKQLNLQEHVIFSGVRKEIPEIMHLFNMFLLPSKLEGLGIVAIEAQACGLPCLLSNNVPKEVDLKLELTNHLVLKQDVWSNAILNNKIHKLENYSLDDCLFNINKTIDVLYKIYE